MKMSLERFTPREIWNTRRKLGLLQTRLHQAYPVSRGKYP